MSRDPEITDPRDPCKRSDIVADLDRWLRVYNFAGLIDVAVIQRARDEIVALRGFRDECERQFQEQVAETGRLLDRLRSARDQALEEAIALCLREARDHTISIGQDNYHDGCVSCAEFIRLKLRDHD